MPSGRVIAAGLPILGVLATVILGAVVHRDNPGPAAGGQGLSRACGCSAPQKRLQVVPDAVPSARRQRIADPAAKTDLGAPRVLAAAGRSRRAPAAPEPATSKPENDATAETAVSPPDDTPDGHALPAPASLRSDAVSRGPVTLLPAGEHVERNLLPSYAPDSTSEASAGSLDGDTLRRALAGTVAGAIAGHTRPSRLLGQSGRPSLLATGLDSVWDIGQQAAVNVLVDGRLPGKRQLKRQAMQVVATAAQQEVASLVDGATQYGGEHGIRFLRNLELRGGWSPGGRPAVEARTIDSLFQSAALDHTLFLEAGVVTDFDTTTANIGGGYRYQPPGSDWMLGLNAFYDRQFPIGHERMSIGLEASTSAFTLFANRYIGLSGWTELKPSLEERPLSGWDLGIAGQMPKLEDLRLSLSAFRWEQDTAKDRIGLRLTGDYAVSPALQLGMTFAGDDAGTFEAGVRMTWELGSQYFEDADMPANPWSDRRLAFVSRENEIRTETRDVPQNYGVTFLAGAVTAANAAALGFVIAGAPLRSRYSYRITSSGGGAPVVGSGLVTADPQPVSGIDVSALGDGTLTLVMQLTSKAGAAGPEVSASIPKSTENLGVAVESASPSPTNQSPIRFRITFSRAVTGFELADLGLTNGTAADLASDDATTWTLAVTPAAQGDVTLQVPANAATADDGQGNTASNTVTVTYDSAAPAGYSVAFLSGPITATGFEIANADPGATYAFTIVSSGGGAPVTGSGRVTALTQQVTGLDLSGLADGTLTLSLTLTDALGNAGAAATTTMTKDANPPVILAITLPAAGDYDDL